MKILIVGYGSIGKRHARLLQSLGCEVAVLSSQNIAEFPRFASLVEGMSAFAPSHIVICTATFRHSESLNALDALGFAGKVLVEKPLFMHSDEYRPGYSFSVHVGYQLRFHPVITALKAQLKKYPPLSAHMYVGQHLSQWRPDRNSRETYSAHRAQGGGVVRDLSHELDLSCFLFGEIMEAQGLVARAGEVTVDSEDAAAFIMRCAFCPVVSLQMNYLDHIPRRELIITTAQVSLKADMIAKKIIINQQEIAIDGDSDSAYLAMHRAWLSDEISELCTLREGLTLMTWMEAFPL